MGDPWEEYWKKDANILIAIYHVIVLKEQITLIQFGTQIHRHTHMHVRYQTYTVRFTRPSPCLYFLINQGTLLSIYGLSFFTALP